MGGRVVFITCPQRKFLQENLSDLGLQSMVEDGFGINEGCIVEILSASKNVVIQNFRGVWPRKRV